jgi:opacity protein-like surface antigen
MKKMILLGALLLSTAAGHAQESRQDVSASVFGLVAPQVHANGPVVMNPTDTLGALVSYRFLLTPRSGLELNYSFAQNTNYFTGAYGGSQTPVPVHSRQQEISGAYVFGLSFRRYNPFLQAGPAAIIETPILNGTATLDAKRKTNIGGLFGGGLAYEISPSFDIRVEYRGILVKAPAFTSDLTTNRYEVISMPAIGIAYHF